MPNCFVIVVDSRNLSVGVFVYLWHAWEMSGDLFPHEDKYLPRQLQCCEPRLTYRFIEYILFRYRYFGFISLDCLVLYVAYRMTYLCKVLKYFMIYLVITQDLILKQRTPFNNFRCFLLCKTTIIKIDLHRSIHRIDFKQSINFHARH